MSEGCRALVWRRAMTHVKYHGDTVAREILWPFVENHWFAIGQICDSLNRDNVLHVRSLQQLSLLGLMTLDELCELSIPVWCFWNLNNTKDIAGVLAISCENTTNIYWLEVLNFSPFQDGIRRPSVPAASRDFGGGGNGSDLDIDEGRPIHPSSSSKFLGGSTTNM